MKEKIYKTQQYLLEKHPTIWNTKIVWVFIVSIIFHLLFFGAGFLSLTNRLLLHKRGAKDLFFENGSVFFSIILSIIILVLWLINLFKNNSFKNFYPTSRNKLFKQFFSYFIIILISTTFYYSYIFGAKSYITLTFKDHQIENEVKTTNNAALFFSHRISDYTLENLKYPSPFDSLHCETNDDFINYKKPYINLFEDKYQFFTLKTKTRDLNEQYDYTKYGGYLYKNVTDSIEIYFYRDSIVDVSQQIKSDKLSYFNHSKVFYTSNETEHQFKDIHLYEDIYPYTDFKNSELRINRNKLNHKLLERNNPKEIKELLQKLLEIANDYKIRHNLTTQEWFELIYTSNLFNVTNFIKPEAPSDTPILEVAPFEDEMTESELFYKDHVTDYYIESGSLHNTFENIEDIKSFNPFHGSIHFFIWFAFLLASLIFAFRVTGLKPLLFSIITAAILLVFCGLCIALFEYSTNSNSNRTEYFAAYFSFIIGSLVLLIPIFFYKKLRKLIIAIFLNISIVCFTLYILLIFIIITMHQSDYCKNTYEHYDLQQDCFVLLDDLGVYSSYILFGLSFIFIYLYSKVIKRWKALPES